MKLGRNSGSPPINANTRDPIECSQSMERLATSSLIPFTLLS
jgi:hypothetical protein